MSKVLRGRMTFSNVVAVVALFVALGGSAYAAGKLSGKSIKPNSLPGNRVKANTLTTKQIKDSTLTAGGLTGVTYVTNPVALPADPGGTSGLITGTATCPAGQKAIGGGALLTNPDVTYIDDVGPAAGNTGWTSRAYPGTTATTLNVTAVCLKVA